MACATAEQLAEALKVRATPENITLLNDCLDAAATEIDHFLGVNPIADPSLALLSRTNVNRAVEWVKAPDAYAGGVGYEATGVLPSPASGFERHAAVLLPLKTSWGVA